MHLDHSFGSATCNLCSFIYSILQFPHLLSESNSTYLVFFWAENKNEVSMKLIFSLLVKKYIFLKFMYSKFILFSIHFYEF